VVERSSAVQTFRAEDHDGSAQHLRDKVTCRFAKRPVTSMGNSENIIYNYVYIYIYCIYKFNQNGFGNKKGKQRGTGGNIFGRKP
jgi:hypothetical protein